MTGGNRASPLLWELSSVFFLVFVLSVHWGFSASRWLGYPQRNVSQGGGGGARLWRPALQGM